MNSFPPYTRRLSFCCTILLPSPNFRMSPSIVYVFLLFIATIPAKPTTATDKPTTTTKMSPEEYGRQMDELYRKQRQERDAMFKAMLDKEAAKFGITVEEHNKTCMGKRLFRMTRTFFLFAPPMVRVSVHNQSLEHTCLGWHKGVVVFFLHIIHLQLP